MNDAARFQRRGRGPPPPLIRTRKEQVPLWGNAEVGKRAVEGAQVQSPFYSLHLVHLLSVKGTGRVKEVSGKRTLWEAGKNSDC